MTRRTISTALALLALALAAPAAAIAPPSDPQYGQQKALTVIRHAAAMQAIGNAPLRDVTVAVLDTGLDLDHPEFASRLVTVPGGTSVPDGYNGTSHTVPAAGSNGWDFLGTGPNAVGTVTPDADPSDPTDGSSHGTAVSSLLGAAANNGQGGAGVAPNARFLAVRSCWDGDQCFQSIQADAINWAAGRGARVFSMSWLAEAADFSGDGAAAAISAHPEALFVTIPSGNGGATDAEGDSAARVPCSYEPAAHNILCVSTSSPEGGLDCGDYGATLVDLAVPTQQNIFATNGGGFAPTGCATSFAAPTAAGAATVLFGLDPTATPSDVKAALIDSARPASAWSGKSVSGGILDLEAAVRLFAKRRGIALSGGTPDRTPPGLTLSLNGSFLRIRLTEAATVSVTVRRRLAGRRVRGHCVTPTRANRRARACTRLSFVRSLSYRNLPGGLTILNFLRVNAHGMLLNRGSYQLTATARDAAGNRSAGRTIRFTAPR